MSAITAEEAAARSLRVQSWPGTPGLAGNVSTASATLHPAEHPTAGHSTLPDQQAADSNSSKRVAAEARGTEQNACTEDRSSVAGAGCRGHDRGSRTQSSAVCLQPLPVLRLPPAETASGIISVSRVGISLHSHLHAYWDDRSAIGWA